MSQYPLRRVLFAAGTLAVIAAALSLYACSRQPPSEPVPRPVKLLQTGSASVAPVIELAGEIRARVESPLGFRTAGKVISRHVESGQRVRRGDALMHIDPRDYQLARRAAESQLAARRADTEIARSEYQRFQNLRQQGHVSEQELDRKRVELAASESALQQAESTAALEANRLADTVLRADADGVVTRVIADAGEVVEPGQVVLVLAQDGPREIVVEFPEDRAQLARIARADVSLWAQPQVLYPATLRELSASADPVTRTFRARYSIKAPAGALALGQSAALRLTLPLQNGGMRLPTTALTEAGGITRVWVFDPASGQVSTTPVQTVGLDGNDVIVAGLPEGAQVVVAGVHLLSEGQKVRPLETAVPPATATAAKASSGAAP